MTQSRREALQAAAHWYARLCSEEAGPADEQALQQWLDSDPIHQWAWQRVDQLQVRLGRVPNHLALNTLERAEQHFSMSRRSVLKGLALMLGTGTLGVAAYRHAPVELWFADHHTATGATKQLTLADGSRLILNTASAVDIRFNANERLVILRAGEVMVTTASGSAVNPRPFIVQTPQGRVRAQGTRFAVRMLEAETKVAVFEHSVEVTTRSGGSKPVSCRPAAYLYRRHCFPTDKPGIHRRCLDTPDVSGAKHASGCVSCRTEPLPHRRFTLRPQCG